MLSNTSSLVVAALLVASCDKRSTEKVSLEPRGAAAAPAPIVVATLTAAPAELAVSVHATGTSRPARQADLAPAMTARIETILVHEGQDVRAGQTLVTLDGRTAQLNAEQARAAAAAGLAQAEQLEADYQRLAPLAQRGSIATNRLEQLDSQRKAARAQVRAAQSAAGAAARVADNAIVRAPFAGTIVDLPHEVGELAGNGSIARLVDLSRLEVEVRVAARDLGRISRGGAVTARFPQLGVAVAGSIVSIGLEVDPATSTGEVVAVVPNPLRALRAGLFAEIEIEPASRRIAIVVPKTAVAGTGTETWVFTVAGGKAVRRAVEIAPFDDTRVEIITGLAGPSVLVDGQLDRISDGAPVTAKPPAAKTAEARP